jgi:hypothetical protein
MSREIDPRDCQHGQADTEDAMKHNVMPCSDQFCKISPVSSRVCEKGTKGCTIYHDSMTTEEKKIISQKESEQYVYQIIRQCKKFLQAFIGKKK